MAVSESPVRDATLLAIDEINARGGVLGARIQPVVVDGASDPTMFVQQAKRLLRGEQVATVFGCWTSSAREAVLPVFEAAHGLLWYPVQYEGLESSPAVIYLGPTINQQAIPAVDYLAGTGKTRFFLLGSDYVYPHVANEIIQEQIQTHPGVSVVAGDYVPLGSKRFEEIIERINTTKPDILLNTLNGESNIAFFSQLRSAGITPNQLVTLSFSVGEQEIQAIGPALMAGDLVAASYFQSINTLTNASFVRAFKDRYGVSRVTDDPVQAAYVAVYLWKAAVEAAGSFDVDRVRTAARGMHIDTPAGPAQINSANQHLSRIARVGRIRPDGQVEQLWASSQPIEPDPYLATYPWAAAMPISRVQRSH